SGTKATVSLLALTVLLAVAFVVAGIAGFHSYMAMAAMGVIALAAAVAVFLHPVWGVYFMVFYVYAALSFYPGSALAAVSVMALILAGVVIGLAGGERWRLTDPVFLMSASIFTLLGLQSMMWAHSVFPAVESYGKYLKAMAIVMFVVQTVRTPDQLNWMGRLIFLGAVTTVVMGSVNLILGIDTGVGDQINPSNMRFKGLHENANFAAASMTSAIPMGVYVARSAKSKLLRALSIAGVLMLVVSVFASYSRQAIFAIAFVTLAVWVREVKSRKAYAAVFGVVLVGVLVTPRYYWMRLWTIREVMESAYMDWSFYVRVLALERAWEMFKDNFFMGVGLRNFAVRSGDALFLRMPVHNMYLEIGCGLGIFGLLAYLTMFYAGLRQFALGIKERWREQDAGLRDLSYYLMVALISCMISGLFANIEFRHFPWMLVGAGLVIANFRRELRAG
ncbi:MAG: O-antigen ligase family protein, partial [Candidatus Latescibacterota bacterium]